MILMLALCHYAMLLLYGAIYLCRGGAAAAIRRRYKRSAALTAYAADTMLLKAAVTLHTP